MQKSSKSSLTTQYMIVFGALLLLANAALGFLLLRQSSSAIQSLIRKSMLNVSNTAAELADGDTLGAFTADDVGSPAYNAVLRDLAAFQNNADIEFIYAVRQVGEDKFVFVVDPDPVEPGAFGEEVLVTPAMRRAGEGVAAVDDAPAQDRWGNFYSAFSPVFDTRGNVAGIIGVDFNSAWYDEQVWKNAAFVMLISALFTAVGASAFFLISSRVRRRFDELRAELSTLSDDVEGLTQEILSGAGDKQTGKLRFQKGADADEGDDIRRLRHKIRAMHREMELYLDYMRAQANTDALTRVGNTTAYSERRKEIEEKIPDGSAAFSAVVFDINDLKRANDLYGHAYGDKIIRAAASAVADGFGRENTFRIGGDEFIAILERTAEEELAARLSLTDKAVAAYNATDAEPKAPLSLSGGYASFVPGQDCSFRDVFVRADKRMYERKDGYHRRTREARETSGNDFSERGKQSAAAREYSASGA